MKTRWGLPDLCAFFRWTAAGRGWRDAKIDRPANDDFQVFKIGSRNQHEPAGNGSGVKSNGHENSPDVVVDMTAWLRALGVAVLAPYEVTLIRLAEVARDKVEAWLLKRKAKVNSIILRYNHRLRRLLLAEKAIGELYKKEGFRQPDHVIPRPVYVPAMVLLGISEFVFNLLAFERLNADNLEKVLIAAGLGFTTPLAAHCLGTTLRQWSKDWPKDSSRWPTILMLALMVGCLLPALWALAWLRQDLLWNEAKTLGIAVSAINYWFIQLSLFVINLFIFAASVGLAFFSHDSNRERERIRSELRFTQKQLKKVWKQWSKTAPKFNKLVGVAVKRVEELQDACLAAISEYRDHNIRNRTDAIPWWMKIAPTMEVFRQGEFDQLVEKGPPPLNEILENIESGKPSLWSKEANGDGTTSMGPRDSEVELGGNGHARINPFFWIVLLVVGLPEGTIAGPLEQMLFPEKARVVNVWVDVSRSIPADDWDLYRRNYHNIVSTLGPGDRIVVGKISTATLTTFRPVIDREIPNKGSTQAKKVLAERTIGELGKTFDLIKPDQNANETRILDGFNVAQQIFDADKHRKIRWLVFLSDMLEDSDVARFQRQKLTSAVINKIIEQRKGLGLLPDLRGVQVFVAGARAQTSSKFSEVQTFWQEYLQATGAVMERGNYVRDGLQFGR